LCFCLFGSTKVRQLEFPCLGWVIIADCLFWGGPMGGTDSDIGHPEKTVCVCLIVRQPIIAPTLIRIFNVHISFAYSRPERSGRVGDIRAKGNFRCTKNIFYHVQPPFRRGWGSSLILYTTHQQIYFLCPSFGHRLSVVQSHSLQSITPLQDFRINFRFYFSPSADSFGRLRRF
jgi:hypothetical protein